LIPPDYVFALLNRLELAVAIYPVIDSQIQESQFTQMAAIPTTPLCFMENSPFNSAWEYEFPY